MNPLFGMRIIQVEPGFVVTHPQTGETLTVEDGEAVAHGHSIYVTAKNYAAIQAQFPTLPDDTPPARKAELWSDGNG